MVRKKSVQQSLIPQFREPWQRGLAIALGLTLGLLPKFSLPFAALLLVTLLLPIPLLLCLGVGLVVSLITPQISGIEQFVGNWILGSAKLQGIWEAVYGSSIARAIGFQNPQVMGSLVVGLACFYPTYLATTIYFQRRRQLDIDSLFAPVNEATPVTIQAQSPATVEPTAAALSIDEVVIDTVLQQRSESIVSGDESLFTAHLLALPNVQVPSRVNMNSVDEKVLEPHVPGPSTLTSSQQPATSNLVYSEEDIAEAERILHELVSAKQHKLNLPANATPQEIEEQQWVLDTLIEIIRLKDEAVKSQELSSTPTSNSLGSVKNLLAPLGATEENKMSQTETTENPINNPTNRATESSMEKLSRTDAGVASTTVNAIGSSEQVERMSSAPPSSVNVVPHNARPRSMHSRDESLRFLIHHLQCLQRERGE